MPSQVKSIDTERAPAGTGKSSPGHPVAPVPVTVAPAVDVAVASSLAEELGDGAAPVVVAQPDSANAAAMRAPRTVVVCVVVREGVIFDVYQRRSVGTKATDHIVFRRVAPLVVAITGDASCRGGLRGYCGARTELKRVRRRSAKPRRS